MLWFHEHGLELPATTPRGEVGWKRPAYGTLYSILTNPIYGGVYAYDKAESDTHYMDGQARKRHRRKPRERWFAFIPKAHEGYMETAEVLRVVQPAAIEAAILA